MKHKKQTLTATGVSSWIPVSPYGDFGVSFGASVGSAGTLTYSIQHSFSDPYLKIPCTFSRTTTSMSITFPVEHGLTSGAGADTVTVHGGDSNSDGKGRPIASITSETVIVVTVSDTGLTSGNINVTPMIVFNHDTVAGIVDIDSNGGYVLPCSAVRAYCSAHTDGDLIVNWWYQ